MSKPLLRGFIKAWAKARGAKKALPFVVPKGFAKSIHGEKDLEKAWRGFRSRQIRGGTGSILADLLSVPAEKLLGTKRVRKALWNVAGAPALKADMAAGRILEKTPLVGKKLFRMKETVPWGKGMHKDVIRSSALAPLAKVRDIAEPIIVGVGLEKALHKVTGSKDMEDQNLREKVASAMLQLHEENKGHKKRAHAIRLLYKQASMGYAQVPQTYEELEEKLANLLGSEDLVVLEKAMELAGGNLKFGELGREDPQAGLTATEQFQAAVLE